MAPTVKYTTLLAAPDTVTNTFPEVAPLGTATTMLVSFQHVEHGVPAVPWNVIVLVPWVAPKCVPVTVTTVPTGPTYDDRLVIVGPETVLVLNAATSAIQLNPDGERVQVPAMDPAEV